MGHEPLNDLHRPYWLRGLAERLIRGVARALWGLRVSGLEYVPAAGPVILASNHASWIDPPLLAAVVGPVRYAWFLAKEELFRIPFLGWLLRRGGALPLNRSGDVVAMRQALDILDHEGCLALFPQGTRVKTGRGAPKAGLGFLAGRTKATVVPAHLVNTDRFPRLHRLEVRLGPGVVFQGDAASRNDCLAFSQNIMDRIFAL